MIKGEGYIVYTPLSCVFNVEEMGGSYIQKYDATAGVYIPDRNLTPFLLTPKLQLTDKDGVLNDGDYSKSLVNCRWKIDMKVKGASPVEGTDYVINDIDHSLSIQCNGDVDTNGKISFVADFVDQRRGDVFHFSWNREINTIAASRGKLILRCAFPTKQDLSPFKSLNQFSIDTQLLNGDTEVSSSDCTYDWQVFDNNSWRDIEDGDLWCVSGAKEKSITIAQDFVQHLIIRCNAWRNDNKSEIKSFVTNLRRWYGQWFPEVDFSEGKIVTIETTRAVIEGKISRQPQGNISSPTDYFDIELFYSRGYSGWIHVGYGIEAAVPRVMFGADSTIKHLCGMNPRELSAEVPFLINGQPLLFNSKLVVGQFPVMDRDI
ncbi:MAG TPA: hypothetical protein DCS83_06870 [Prevotella sp.]|nr:hypothetical protein [Prevotella sp.]